MYRKILVPLDGSYLSTGVLPSVRYLAGRLHLPVELLYVHDPALLAAYAPSLIGEFLDSAAKSFPPSLTVTRMTENGSPANVIVEQARAEPETLVAMATHGYSGAARWLLGSVAEKVSHGLTSDLLLLRPPQGDPSGEKPLRTILVPLDFSAAAEAVLPTALNLAKSLDLDIVLIHATKRFYPAQPETFAPAFGSIPNLKDLWEQDTAAAEKYLNEKAQLLRSQAVVRVQTRCLAGGVDGAAGEIVDLAQEIPESLIAMTPHGQSGIGGWLMGGITRRVIQYSRKPVLVVRSPNAAGAASA